MYIYIHIYIYIYIYKYIYIYIYIYNISKGFIGNAGLHQCNIQIYMVRYI